MTRKTSRVCSPVRWWIVGRALGLLMIHYDGNSRLRATVMFWVARREGVGPWFCGSFGKRARAGWRCVSAPGVGWVAFSLGAGRGALGVSAALVRGPPLGPRLSAETPPAPAPNHARRSHNSPVRLGPHPFGRPIGLVVVKGVRRSRDEAEDRALVVGDHRHAPVRAVGRGADHLAAVAGYQVNGLVGVGGAEVDAPERRVGILAAARVAADAADDLLTVDEQRGVVKAVA